MAAAVDDAAVLLVPELRENVRQVEAQTAELRALVAGHEAYALAWRPDGRRWSIAQHVVHLTRTTRRYLTEIDASVEAARARGLTGPGPYRHGWIGNGFARSMEPPPRIRIRTFKALEPGEPGTAAEVLTEFVGVQHDLGGSLVRANGVDLGRARIRSPFVRALRLTVGQAYRVILAHNRRHIWHIRQIESAPGFPGRAPEGGRAEGG